MSGKVLACVLLNPTKSSFPLFPLRIHRWSRRAHHRAVESKSHDWGTDMDRLIVQIKALLAEIKKSASF
jgi:hypothetical protein